MKLALFIYLFLHCFFVIFAGQNNVKNKDTIAVNLLIKTGKKHHTEDADTAIIVLKKAMTVSHEIKYESGYVQSGFLLATIYKQKGLFYDAIKTIDYLLKYSEQNNKKELKGRCLYALGEINRAAFYTDKALNNLFEALAIFRERKNNIEQAKCYNRISAVYFEQKNMKKSEIFADSSNQIAIQSNQHLLLASNEELLGAIYRRTNRYNDALKKLKNALHWTFDSKDSTDIPNILNNFAYTYLEMKNFDKAIEFANQSFEMSRKKNILVYTSNAAQILSDCYRAKNQLEKAYNFLRFRDSLSYKSLMNDRNKIIMDLNEKYETEKKEKQQILLQQESELKSITIRNQKYLFGLSVFILMIVSIAAFMIYLGKKQLAKTHKRLEIKKEKISQQHMQISEAYEQLKELESFKESITGMIVHDLKNPLNTVINPASYLSDKQQLSSVQQAGHQMLNLINNILDVQKYESHNIILNKLQIQLDGLIADAVSQIQILADQKNQKIIIQNALNYSIFADEEILCRIIVNLLTNAMKHSPNNSEIKILTEFKSGNIFLHIEDNGEGIPLDKQEMVFNKFSQVIAKKSGLARSTGLGLAFCKLAIEAHGGTISLKNNYETGSIFTICLPAKVTENSSELNVNFTQDKIDTISFSEEEKNQIFPIIEELKKYEIFEISKIRKALNTIPENQSSSIKQWIDKINTTVYSGNETVYKELLGL